MNEVPTYTFVFSDIAKFRNFLYSLYYFLQIMIQTDFHVIDLDLPEESYTVGKTDKIRHINQNRYITKIQLFDKIYHFTSQNTFFFF